MPWSFICVGVRKKPGFVLPFRFFFHLLVISVTFHVNNQMQHLNVFMKRRSDNEQLPPLLKNITFSHSIVRDRSLKQRLVIYTKLWKASKMPCLCPVYTAAGILVWETQRLTFTYNTHIRNTLDIIFKTVMSEMSIEVLLLVAHLHDLDSKRRCVEYISKIMIMDLVSCNNSFVQEEKQEDS